MVEKEMFEEYDPVFETNPNPTPEQIEIAERILEKLKKLKQEKAKNKDYNREFVF